MRFPLEVLMILTRRIALGLALLTLPACAGTNGTTNLVSSGSGGSSVSRIVIRVSEMASPVNLVTLIQSRVTNLEVNRSGPCPEFEFRGRNSVMGPTPPGVYVNGQHTLNTCVLEILDPQDIDLVEVYPQGVANRPGYHSTAGGLILVFLKDGSPADAADPNRI
jgi:hypothetical protein